MEDIDAPHYAHVQIRVVVTHHNSAISACPGEVTTRNEKIDPLTKFI